MTQKLRKGDLRELKSKNISQGSMSAVLPRIGNRSVFILDPRLKAKFL